MYQRGVTLNPVALEIPQRPGDLTGTQVRGQGSKRDGVGGYAEIRLNYELEGLWKETRTLISWL